MDAGKAQATGLGHRDLRRHNMTIDRVARKLPLHAACLVSREKPKVAIDPNELPFR